MKTAILSILGIMLPSLVETAEANFTDGASKKAWVTSIAKSLLTAFAPELNVPSASVTNAISGVTDIIVGLKNEFGWGEPAATAQAAPAASLHAAASAGKPAAAPAAAAATNDAPVPVATAEKVPANPQQPAANAASASGSSEKQSDASVIAKLKAFVASL